MFKVTAKTLVKDAAEKTTNNILLTLQKLRMHSQGEKM